MFFYRLLHLEIVFWIFLFIWDKGASDFISVAS